MLLSVLIGLVSALAAAWVALAAVLILARPKGLEWRGLAVFIPNVLRLLRRLYRDSNVPRTVRVRVWIAIAYNIQPINLIPDFVPVLGLVDNVVVTAWALRSAVRKAGMEAVSRHWPGAPDQFTLLIRVTGLQPHPPDTDMIQGRPNPGLPTV